ncbi:hypothetical protein SeLEV6574_g05087 [Synchytrium endobioticum]|uniref:Vacuolar protein sorting-associated protein 29 n=1 Tax=Synchytrium endobioticum TaxID=286115 RepID=A0A507CWH6_9FUNG|nr:hypothetical protein SeLEV6574_g05087 [Synchytrium endobioticum]
MSNRETLDYLRTVASDVTCVRGDTDEYLPAPPSHKILTQGSLRIGCIHGHQILPWGGHPAALAATARQLDVDVLITGHTHKFAAFEMDGRFYINPGSATGAFTSDAVAAGPVVPSFVLMDVQGASFVLYVYKLIDNEVKVEKLDYAKRT